jgi:hypothetical protein
MIFEDHIGLKTDHVLLVAETQALLPIRVRPVALWRSNKI